ncbi:hypothetical protein Taro_028291 [Colocasia esculenta]|uniref:Aminotransferase-like plant mobile domain-containing protein n=1 Tax=Colocasia esculenta TaxID=4460 RepID=A0A843VGW7_COLES|nr:hypothetical protein [Colocasia esculenta]
MMVTSLLPERDVKSGAFLVATALWSPSSSVDGSCRFFLLAPQPAKGQEPHASLVAAIAFWLSCLRLLPWSLVEELQFSSHSVAYSAGFFFMLKESIERDGLLVATKVATPRYVAFLTRKGFQVISGDCSRNKRPIYERDVSRCRLLKEINPYLKQIIMRQIATGRLSLWLWENDREAVAFMNVSAYDHAKCLISLHGHQNDVRELQVLSWGRRVPYEGPKRARTTYGALMRLTDVPNHLSKNKEVRELFPGSHRYSKLTWIMIKALPMFVIQFLREWGLGGVLIAAHKYHKISFDWHSINALIELWHPQTHTFIFPKFEATVLEEVEVFLALPKTKWGDEQNICYTVKPINPKLILGEFMTDPGDVYTMISPQSIHLFPLSKWLISQCKNKSADHREIAKAVAICLCRVVLFPSGDHLIDYASLSAISGVWRGLSLSHAVLAYLYAGLTLASTGGSLYGSMILLECWTADKKMRSAWRHYLNTLPVEHFALGIAALREKAKDKLLKPSHLPPMKKRRLGDPEDEQAVWSALALWQAYDTHVLPPTLNEERETYQAYLREHEKIRLLGDPSLLPSSSGVPPPFSGGLAMEGGDGQGGDGGDGGRRRKKTIRRRKTGEGPSVVAQEEAPTIPMEEDLAAAPGEDEPIGPKKVGALNPNLCVIDVKEVQCTRLQGVFLSELRSRLGWAVVRAIYQGLPDFHRARLEEMGFGPFLRLDELTPDVALIQALKERWDPECHAFLLPWGHMTPTLEDVARITGLRVDG